MHASMLFLTARAFDVPEEDADDPQRAAAALAKLWSDRRMTVEEIHQKTRLSRYQIQEIFGSAGYKLKTIGPVGVRNEMAVTV